MLRLFLFTMLPTSAIYISTERISKPITALWSTPYPNPPIVRCMTLRITCQHDFFRAGGVEILELLLRSASEATFALAGAHTVIVLEAIYLACGLHDTMMSATPRVQYSAGDNNRVHFETPSLQHHVVHCLLSNFSLWARAPPAVQFGLASRLRDLVRENPSRFRCMVSIEVILSSIQMCCSDEVSSTSDDAPTGIQSLAVAMQTLNISNSEGFKNSSAQCGSEEDATKQNWTRMAKRERWHMRRCLWDVIRLLIAERTTQENGVTLVRFLASCDDVGLVRLRRVVVCKYILKARVSSDVNIP